MALNIRHEYTCDRCTALLPAPPQASTSPRVLIAAEYPTLPPLTSGERMGSLPVVVSFTDLCERCDRYVATLVGHIASPRKRGRKPRDARAPGTPRKSRPKSQPAVEPEA